jgi:hypothetical protein
LRTSIDLQSPERRGFCHGKRSAFGVSGALVKKTGTHSHENSLHKAACPSGRTRRARKRHITLLSDPAAPTESSCCIASLPRAQARERSGSWCRPGLFELCVWPDHGATAGAPARLRRAARRRCLMSGGLFRSVRTPAGAALSFVWSIDAGSGVPLFCVPVSFTTRSSSVSFVGSKEGDFGFL